MSDNIVHKIDNEETKEGVIFTSTDNYKQYPIDSIWKHKIYGTKVRLERINTNSIPYEITVRKYQGYQIYDLADFYTLYEYVGMAKYSTAKLMELPFKVENKDE